VRLTAEETVQGPSSKTRNLPEATIMVDAAFHSLYCYEPPNLHPQEVCGRGKKQNCVQRSLIETDAPVVGWEATNGSILVCGCVVNHPMDQPEKSNTSCQLPAAKPSPLIFIRSDARHRSMVPVGSQQSVPKIKKSSVRSST
jgi:hypothetical protein